jgi:hypothetical protein
MIAIVEVEDAHGGFEMVHAKTFVPIAKPVIEVVGERELVITPDPETSVHAPIPITAVLPAKLVVGEEIQRV